jgi:hypothetical protein
MGRVRIGTCSGPPEVALIRSVFSAHGIRVAIGAEEHANMLGGLGGGFLRLDISVDEADAEEAVALLADIRDGEHAAPIENAADDDEPYERATDPTAILIDRRRRTIVALLLAFCISLGTAHMFTRAWLRGVLLAGLELLGLAWMSVGSMAGVLLVAAAILGDAIGAVSRIWKQLPVPALPVARVRR